MSFLDLMRQQGLTPIGSGGPMQVPGGVPGEEPQQTIERASKLETGTQEAQQTKNFDIYNGISNLSGSLGSLTNLYDQAEHQGIDIGARGYLGQVRGQGGGAIAHTSRLQQIDTGIGNPDMARRQEILQSAIKAAQVDAAFKRQAYSRVSRGGGQGNEANASGQETSGSMGRGNIAMVQDMIGTTATDTAAGLRAKLNQGWNDVFDGYARINAADPKTYSADRFIKEMAPYGWKPNEVLQGLKARRNPRDLPGAGGAQAANRAQHTPPAAGPHNGVDVDQEGTKPTIQAGLGGQGERDVTDRSGKEPVAPNQLIPEMPKQVPPERQGQWSRAVQILFQHPESAAEFDKRFSPGMPGMAKRILQQRPRGFDQ